MMYEDELPEVIADNVIVPEEEEEEEVPQACVSDPCTSPIDSPMLTLPCGHTIHNSCLYELALRHKGVPMPGRGFTGNHGVVRFHTGGVTDQRERGRALPVTNAEPFHDDTASLVQQRDSFHRFG